MSVNAAPLLAEFDAAVYRLTAIKKAAYRFGDRCHVEIETAPGGRIRVTLRAKQSPDDPQCLLGEFRNEVLDQDLREIVAEETEAVRNLLLAQAFSPTSLLDPQGETGDYNEDPLGVRPSDVQKLDRMQAAGRDEKSGTGAR
jgi:His-Xaa-Ser system protein HxsD